MRSDSIPMCAVTCLVIDISVQLLQCQMDPKFSLCTTLLNFKVSCIVCYVKKKPKTVVSETMQLEEVFREFQNSNSMGNLSVPVAVEIIIILLQFINIFVRYLFLAQNMNREVLSKFMQKKLQVKLNLRTVEPITWQIF